MLRVRSRAILKYWHGATLLHNSSYHDTCLVCSPVELGGALWILAIKNVLEKASAIWRSIELEILIFFKGNGSRSPVTMGEHHSRYRSPPQEL